MERGSVNDLLKAIADDEMPLADEKSPAAPSSESNIGESIFSQLLLRLVAGRGLKLRDAVEDNGSLEILLENSRDPILLLTSSGVVIDANPAFCQVSGWSGPEVLERSLLSLIPEDAWSTVAAKMFGPGDRRGKTADEPDNSTFDLKLRAKGGALLPVECTSSSIWSGSERRIIAVLRSLSPEKALLAQLRETNDHYLALSETITEAIFRLSQDFTIIFVNSGVKNTFGFDREELINKNFSVLFPEEVFAQHQKEFVKYFIVDDQDRAALGLRQTIELLGITKNRGVTPMEMSFGNSRDFSGRTLTCIVRDISQRKTMERRLRHLAYHDKLTGLGNRDLFNEDMKAFLKDADLERGEKAALLFLDLDGFKHVNDTIGHSAGDELLVETARRIRFCLRDTDSAYRFGGDEFVAFLPKVGGAAQSGLAAERILAAICQPYEVTTDIKTQARIGIGVSIGIALMPDHGTDAGAITKSADIAMYCSKEGGKNRVTLYDESLNTRSNRNWQVEQDMRNALVKGEFDLYYQPIVAPSGKLLGLEALIRWKRPGSEYMPPSSFIPIAEENGMIIPLGSWVFRRACIDLKRLREAGFGKAYFSVNVSGRQFEQPDFVAKMCDAIDQSGVDPSRLNLELTETTLMNNADDAVKKMRAIKRRYPSLLLSIDDFGTGYSSLSYLTKLPVDVLKIDISFVRALHDEQNRKVVTSILSLADSLGIHVVAEGIETKEQREYFYAKKCYGMQGFLFMDAQPIDELIRRFLAIRKAGKGKARLALGKKEPGRASKRKD